VAGIDVGVGDPRRSTDAEAAWFAPMDFDDETSR
jgi:hypothetical protein